LATAAAVEGGCTVFPLLLLPAPGAAPLLAPAVAGAGTPVAPTAAELKKDGAAEVLGKCCAAAAASCCCCCCALKVVKLLADGGTACGASQPPSVPLLLPPTTAPAGAPAAAAALVPARREGGPAAAALVLRPAAMPAEMGVAPPAAPAAGSFELPMCRGGCADADEGGGGSGPTSRLRSAGSCGMAANARCCCSCCCWVVDVVEVGAGGAPAAAPALVPARGCCCCWWSGCCARAGGGVPGAPGAFDDGPTERSKPSLEASEVSRAPPPAPTPMAGSSTGSRLDTRCCCCCCCCC